MAKRRPITDELPPEHRRLVEAIRENRPGAFQVWLPVVATALTIVAGVAGFAGYLLVTETEAQAAHADIRTDHDDDMGRVVESLHDLGTAQQVDRGKLDRAVSDIAELQKELRRRTRRRAEDE